MKIIDTLFPKECLGCGRLGGYLCQDCAFKLKRTKATCPVCEKPSIDGMTHIKCKKPQNLDGLMSVWAYEGVAKKIIKALKFRFAKEISYELADLDQKDKMLLKALSIDARAPIVKVAQDVGLSADATNLRMKKLQKNIEKNFG